MRQPKLAWTRSLTSILNVSKKTYKFRAKNLFLGGIEPWFESYRPILGTEGVSSEKFHYLSLNSKSAKAFNVFPTSNRHRIKFLTLPKIWTLGHRQKVSILKPFSEKCTEVLNEKVTALHLCPVNHLSLKKWLRNDWVVKLSLAAQCILCLANFSVYHMNTRIFVVLASIWNRALRWFCWGTEGLA